MSKHKNLLLHRHYTNIGISDKGGVIIKFEDKSHTYIPFNDFVEVLKKMSELIDQHKISIEEE